LTALLIGVDPILHFMFHHVALGGTEAVVYGFNLLLIRRGALQFRSVFVRYKNN
jgi:hypothetical protein